MLTLIAMINLNSGKTELNYSKMETLIVPLPKMVTSELHYLNQYTALYTGAVHCSTAVLQYCTIHSPSALQCCSAVVLHYTLAQCTAMMQC